LFLLLIYHFLFQVFSEKLPLRCVIRTLIVFASFKPSPAKELVTVKLTIPKFSSEFTTSMKPQPFRETPVIEKFIISIPNSLSLKEDNELTSHGNYVIIFFN